MWKNTGSFQSSGFASICDKRCCMVESSGRFKGNYQSQSRKIHADLFIDDRNVGGFPGWGEIYQMINPNQSTDEHEAYKQQYQKAQRKTITGFIKYMLSRE